MLEVRNISKSYDTRQARRRVLDDVSFTLAKGRNLGILGCNGAGKSTLIRLISGAEQPSHGTIQRGMTVSWPLAFGGAFSAHLTGLDNLKFVCRLHGVDYRPLVSFVEDFTELGTYFREPVLHYSHGMLSRLAFALSMAVEFDCFLIDEAMVVGDARFHQRCHDELFTKRKDRAFILVTHDANVIKLYCEAASVLYNGKLIPFDSVDEAYAFYNESLKSPATPPPVQLTAREQAS